MVDNLIQCCYTNDGGWKSVAVSEGIQNPAYAFCTRFQVVNSDIPTEGWKTESGDDLNLFEIHGDSAFVYICRTQYGLTDRMGRRNMFSHAFILPWSDALENPNRFLTIANENFAADLETAERQREGVYLPPFKLADALSNLGMDQAAYLALIRAVYVQLSENKTPDPLYIAYDGSDCQLRELLYCIYVGLPFHLRKQLNVASAATKAPERMQLIFSVGAASQRRYFIPRTGQENVLTQKLVSRIERIGYIDHAPLRLREELEPPGAFLDYFKKLADGAAALGDEGGKNDLTFRIAYRMMLGADYDSMNESELDLRLTEALRAKPRANSKLDDYIASLLRVMTKRGLTLAEGASDLLKQRLDDEAYPDGLTAAADAYYVALLKQESPDEAAKQLSGLSEPLFSRYGGILRDTDWGRKILARYYNETVYAGKEPDWEFLRSIRDKSAVYGIAEQVEDTLGARAWELYSRALNGGDAPAELANYEALMTDILPPEKKLSCIASAKEAYWDSVTFSSYSPEKEDEYQAMWTDCVRYNMFEEYKNLLTFRVEREIDEQTYLSKTVNFFSREVGFGEELAKCEQSELDGVVSRLAQAVREDPAGKTVHFFSEWIELSARMGLEDFPHKPLTDLYSAVSGTLSCHLNSLSKPCHSLCGAMQRFTEYRDVHGVSASRDELLSRALRLAGKECLNADSKEQPIALDVWLTLGTLLIGEPNCYTLFDTMKPSVLEQEPEDVLTQSELFESSRDAAKAYVENKGSEAKAVKRWLRAAKKKEKNFFNSMVSHFSQMLESQDNQPDRTPSPTEVNEQPNKGAATLQSNAPGIYLDSNKNHNQNSMQIKSASAQKPGKRQANNKKNNQNSKKKKKNKR